MVNRPEKLDNRQVRRTRQLLYDALRHLLKRKSFHAITVHDITEEAGLNRGTFYLHFPDKYALLDDTIREEFQQVLAAQLGDSSSLTRETLHLLSQTTLEYLVQTYDRCRSSDKPVGSLVEIAVQQELYQRLTTWLTTAQAKGNAPLASAETIAMIVSWSIFGVAAQWRQEQCVISSQELTRQVTTVLIKGLSAFGL